MYIPDINHLDTSRIKAPVNPSAVCLDAKIYINKLHVKQTLSI